MLTKATSIEMEAYRLLKAAKTGPGDSFSQVIRRAQWEAGRRTCGGLLSVVKSMPAADLEVIDLLDAAQAADLPPDDHWA